MPQRSTCFVMMPFSPRFQSYFERIYAPVIRGFDLVPIKVDEIYTATQITHDIFKLIADADIIVADVTGKNPNVNYELGIAHALGKRTVIVTQSADDVPFDYKHLRHIKYETHDAGWEDQLRINIGRFIASTMAINQETKLLEGDQLKRLFTFLENTANDSSYEISKESTFVSDLSGNCSVSQTWNITARSPLSHFIHGIMGDEPGKINLKRAYDRTNGVHLDSVATISEDKRVRFVFFLSKMLQKSEKVCLDIEYSAESYLSHLFSKGRETIFQRPNSRRAVLYRRRKDTYILPANEQTEHAFINSDGLPKNARVDRKVESGLITLSVEAIWKRPTSAGISYELILSP